MGIPNKRKDFQDSELMDALDASCYNISQAAKRLGVQTQTLYRWVKESENLTKYICMRTEIDAVRARDRLNEILEQADALDPRIMGNIISICKILLDKQESDKTEIDVNARHMINEDLNNKIKKLLGDS